MNIKRILCPVDFSEFNHAANEYASMLASSTGARIIYLHTYLPDVLYGNPELFDSKQKERHLLQKMEETYQPTVDGVEASYVVEFGTPADRIVDYATSYEIDMIVLGTHGRTGLRRVVMGSVAEAVVRSAECPVLAIKTEAKVLQEN
jgi:universal stress protein A